MSDGESAMPTAPLQQALDTLRAVTDRHEGTALDEDLLARISIADFDASGSANSTNSPWRASPAPYKPPSTCRLATAPRWSFPQRSRLESSAMAEPAADWRWRRLRVDDETGNEARDARQAVTIKFKPPITRPGTPEAQRHGCLCRFESNLEAAFLTAERPDEDLIVVIHDDCPIHEIVRAPMDDTIGKDPPRS